MKVSAFSALSLDEVKHTLLQITEYGAHDIVMTWNKLYRRWSMAYYYTALSAWIWD